MKTKKMKGNKMKTQRKHKKWGGSARRRGPSPSKPGHLAKQDRVHAAMLQEQQEVARQAQHEVERQAQQEAAMQAQQEAARQASNTHRSATLYVPPDQPPLWLVRNSIMVREYVDIARIRSQWANSQVRNLENMLRSARTQNEFDSIQLELVRVRAAASEMQRIFNDAPMSALAQFQSELAKNEDMIGRLDASSVARAAARAAAPVVPFVWS